MSPRKASSVRRVSRARVTHAEVDARYDRAKELARAGSHAEALVEFLWCYDEGMVAVGSFTGVRNSFLLSQIAKLGAVYPPALDALRSRRDAVERSLFADLTRMKGLSDYSDLNHYLNEDEKTLALFDQIPAGDPLRTKFGLSVYRLLVRTGRHAEAVEARPYKSMISLFEAVIENPVPSGFSKRDRLELERNIRGHSINSAATDIEVLARAGKLASARAFVKKLLAYDDTSKTRRLLRDTFIRAGRPELADDLSPRTKPSARSDRPRGRP